MALRLYLDEDVDPLLARVLRDRGHDCVSTLEAANRGLSDEDQLSYATNQGRAIVTFNIKDFVQLAKRRGGSHAGIIVSDHLPFRDLLRRISAMLADLGDRDISGRLIWLHAYKTPSERL